MQDWISELRDLSSRLNRARKEVNNPNLWLIADYLADIMRLLDVDGREAAKELERLASRAISAADRDPTIYMLARQLLFYAKRIKDMVERWEHE